MLTDRQKIALHRLYRKCIYHLPLKGSPSIFIVGAQKAGTTSLHEYLCFHPQISGGLLKELHFFNRDSHYARGTGWYEKNFKNFNFYGPDVKFIDATPEYMTSPLYVDRLATYNSQAKILIILREPASRAYSAWNFYMKLPQFSRKLYDFNTLVNHEINHLQSSAPFTLATLGIVGNGCYSRQVGDIFRQFPKDQVMILGFEDLRDRPHETLEKIFRFAEVSPYDPYKCIKRKRNKGRYSPLPVETQEILQEFYKPYNEELFNLIGYRPSW